MAVNQLTPELKTLELRQSGARGTWFARDPRNPQYGWVPTPFFAPLSFTDVVCALSRLPVNRETSFVEVQHV